MRTGGFRRPSNRHPFCAGYTRRRARKRIAVLVTRTTIPSLPSSHNKPPSTPFYKKPSLVPSYDKQSSAPGNTKPVSTPLNTIPLSAPFLHKSHRPRLPSIINRPLVAITIFYRRFPLACPVLHSHPHHALLSDSPTIDPTTLTWLTGWLLGIVMVLTLVILCPLLSCPSFRCLSAR